MLDAGCGVQGVGGVIVRIDERGRTCAVGKIAWIYGRECFHPAVLCEVRKVESGAAAENGFCGVAQGVGYTEPRRKRLAVVVRDSGDDAIAGKRGIDALGVAGSNE